MNAFDWVVCALLGVALVLWLVYLCFSQGEWR